MLRLAPAFNIRLIQDLVFNLSITVGVVIHLCAKGGRRLATEVDDAGVCAPTLPVENLALRRVVMRDIVFHNRLEAESVARI
jgi:hypothetical protein